MKSEDPKIDGHRYRNPSKLATDLMRDLIPLPAWIQFDNSGLRVTPENKEGVIQGLMIAAEIYDTTQ